jgi:uncharacterized protein YfaS (alpha-2-macroglobulin family)
VARTWWIPRSRPYIAEFLLDAREAGFAVPEAMLQKTLKALNEDLLSGGPQFYNYDHRAHLMFAYRAHAGYALARVNRAPLGTLRALYDDERSKAETGLPLVRLGHRVVAAGRPPSWREGDRRRASRSTIPSVRSTSATTARACATTR